jgi:hypothetical protein
MSEFLTNFDQWYDAYEAAAPSQQDALLQAAIAATNALKPQLIEGFEQRLWQYNFVHRWQRPHCISKAEFLAEAELFAASLQQSEPLSDEPVDDFPFSFGDNFLDTKNLNLPIVHDRIESKAQPTPTVTPTWKPPKPRKSALQEASELPSQKPSSQSKSSKGKKKKGFQ